MTTIKLIGSNPNQVSRNRDLGSLAFQSSDNVIIENLTTSNDASISGITIGKGGGSGSSNTIVGTGALSVNTTGINNTAIGLNALGANTTTSSNTAVGYQAGLSNTSGNVTAFGANAGQSNTTGVNNTSIGFLAATANTTGSSNTTVGTLSMATNTIGIQNTIIGYLAGQSLTTNNSTFIGTGAGSTITTGTNNTVLGRYNGNQGGLDIRTLSDYLVLSDGNGNPRIYHNGITVVIPNLPISATGLPTGGLWNDSGTLKVA